MRLSVLHRASLQQACVPLSSHKQRGSEVAVRVAGVLQGWTQRRLWLRWTRLPTLPLNMAAEATLRPKTRMVPLHAARRDEAGKRDVLLGTNSVLLRWAIEKEHGACNERRAKEAAMSVPTLRRAPSANLMSEARCSRASVGINILACSTS